METKNLFKKLFGSQIFKDKYASTALVVLLILYLGILFADFLAPYSKEFSATGHMFRRQRFLLLTKTANSRVLIHTTTKDTLTPRSSKLLTNWTGAKSII